jgi:hypothetical protein
MYTINTKTKYNIQMFVAWRYLKKKSVVRLRAVSLWLSFGTNYDLKQLLFLLGNLYL